MTFEFASNGGKVSETELRVVPAAELNQDALAGTDSDEIDCVANVSNVKNELDALDDERDDAELMKNNRETIDDSKRQKLSMNEIEELKQAQFGSGKEIISKIMESHTALDEKTAYSLAKYTLRKSKKFLRRFTVLPLNVSNLLQWISMERESHKIMDLREEMLGLIASWVNIHYSIPQEPSNIADIDEPRLGNGRWLLVEDTSGLLLASLAERLDILYREEESNEDLKQDTIVVTNGHVEADAVNGDGSENVSKESSDARITTGYLSAEQSKTGSNTMQSQYPNADQARLRRLRQIPAMSARDNTITLIHPSSQPNLALLRYFGYDSNDPPMDHPLYTHLKSLSWLQLLHPEEDPLYEEPKLVSDDVIQSWKGGKRSTYHKKRRRWEKVKRVTDETRAGQFDGLVVASTMEPVSVLRHTVPLLRGGAQVVVYSPYVEPLAELADYYSKARRVAYAQEMSRQKGRDGEPGQVQLDEEDFPVDPTALLSPKIQTSRVRAWQVLPGRTHPVMTSKGGAEGYIFTATKVLPATGSIQGRGAYGKRRKVEKEET